MLPKRTIQPSNLNLLFIVVLVVFLLTTGIALPAAARSGESLSFELNANSSDIEGKMVSTIRLPKNQLVIGAGGIYSDNDYGIYDLNLSARGNIILPQLCIGLGFKGVVGDADEDGQDYDLAACNFLLFGEYDFRKLAARIPVSIASYVAFAPSPLGFLDTKRYAEFNASVYGHIVDNAAIVAGFRSIYMLFEKDKIENRKRDEALFVGLKISF